MKRISALAVVFLAFLTIGCPAPMVPTESPVMQGKMVAEIDLNQLVQDSGSEKSLSPNDWMGLLSIQAPKVRRVRMMFLDSRTQESRGCVEQAVVDGRSRVNYALNPGSYTMLGGFWDESDKLFYLEKSFGIVSGQETRIDVIAVLSPMCRVGFILDGKFPAVALAATKFSITCQSWRGLYQYFYGSLWFENGFTRAEVWLPWDFQGGQMDIIGTNVSSAASFNWLWMASGRDWVLPYKPEGTVDANFEFWWPGRVKANGVDYASIQDAIDANAGNVANIELGPGGYQVTTIVVPPNTRVSIIGVSGQTQIYASEACALHASEIPGGKAVKGGGGCVVLQNLDIVAAGAGSGYYYDAVVFVEAMGLTVTNCSIRAIQSRAAVSTNYSSWTYLEHCVIQSPVEGVVVYNGNQQGNEVHSSVFLGCDLAIDAEGGNISVQKCCFWQCKLVANFAFDPASGNFSADPLFRFDPFETQSDFRLQADSPLIGAAGDGSDIGLML
ncbi:MAG: hypothetical protein WC768_03240 [Patescibacteria group bacterium]|jgi:hypothetical protein